MLLEVSTRREPRMRLVKPSSLVGTQASLWPRLAQCGASSVASSSRSSRFGGGLEGLLDGVDDLGDGGGVGVELGEGQERRVGARWR